MGLRSYISFYFYFLHIAKIYCICSGPPLSVAPLPNYEYGKGRGDYEDYGRGAPAPQDMDDPYARVLYRNRNVNSQSASRIHQQGSYT